MHVGVTVFRTWKRSSPRSRTQPASLLARRSLREVWRRQRGGRLYNVCVRAAAYAFWSQSAVQRIPLLKTRAGPRDEAWLTRLAEEYNALIKVSQRPSSPLATVAWHRRLTPCQCPPLRPSVFSASTSKTTKSPTRTGSKSSPTRPASSTHCPPAPPEPPDRLTSFRGPHATRWTGTCWHVHELLKYEFRLEFEVRPTPACLIHHTHAAASAPLDPAPQRVSHRSPQRTLQRRQS